MTGRTGGTAPGLVAAAVLLLAASACGGDSGGADGGEAARDTASDTASASAAAADSAGDADSASEDARPLRAFRFTIRNDGGDTVIVAADAGAGARTLDTVPPADSAEVRVETRAALLELGARDPAGEEVARSRYELERAAGDTLLDFRIAPPGAEADSAGG